MELGFWILIVSGIPDSLSRVLDSKTQESRFHKKMPGFRYHKQKFPWFRNSDSLTCTYLGGPNRLKIFPSKYRPWTTFGIKNISNRGVICNYIYKNFNWCHPPNCKNSNQKDESDYNKTDMCFKNIVSECWKIPASDRQSNPALRTPGHPLIITDSLHCVWGKKALTLSLIKFNPRTLSLIKITGFPYL